MPALKDIILRSTANACGLRAKKFGGQVELAYDKDDGECLIVSYRLAMSGFGEGSRVHDSKTGYMNRSGKWDPTSNEMQFFFLIAQIGMFIDYRVSDELKVPFRREDGSIGESSIMMNGSPQRIRADVIKMIHRAIMKKEDYPYDLRDISSVNSRSLFLKSAANMQLGIGAVLYGLQDPIEFDIVNAIKKVPKRVKIRETGF